MTSAFRRRDLILGVLPVILISHTASPSSAQSPTKLETQMQIKRNGQQASQKGPADWFSGQVRIDPLHTAEAPARVGSATVTFEPGARTAWHTHPLGQTLVIVSGTGWVQREGSPIEIVRPGDVVWFPPSVRHWHGATPDNAMTHIAIQEALDGKMVEWMEHVTDEHYLGRSTTQSEK